MREELTRKDAADQHLVDRLRSELKEVLQQCQAVKAKKRQLQSQMKEAIKALQCMRLKSEEVGTSHHLELQRRQHTDCLARAQVDAFRRL